MADHQAVGDWAMTSAVSLAMREYEYRAVSNDSVSGRGAVLTVPRPALPRKSNVDIGPEIVYWLPGIPKKRRDESGFYRFCAERYEHDP